MLRLNKVVVIAVCVVSLAGLSGCDMIMGIFRAQKAAVKWDGPIKEIAYEKIEKDGRVFDIEIHSRVDAPIDKVWAAMKQPELLADNSDMYKLSRLIKSEGNKKELEIHMLALDNLQTFTIELTFNDENKTIEMKTLESSIVDIQASYELTPSPDGTKTLYVYKSTQTDKIILPISTDVQRSAIKESFVNQVKAMKLQMGMG